MNQDLFRNIEVIYYIVMIVVGIPGAVVTTAVGLKTLGPDWRTKFATAIIISLPTVAMFAAMWVDTVLNNLYIAAIILFVSLSLLVINFLLVMKGPVGRHEIVYLVVGCVMFSLNMTYVLTIHVYRSLGRILDLIEKMQGHH